MRMLILAGQHHRPPHSLLFPPPVVYVALLLLLLLVLGDALGGAPPLEGLASTVAAFPKTIARALEKLHAMQNAKTATAMVRQHNPLGHPDGVDKFLGVTTGPIRQLATPARLEDAFTVADAWRVVDLPFKEERLLGLVLLEHRFSKAGRLVESRKAKVAAAARRLRKEIAEELVRRVPTHLANNQLIEEGARYILGEYATRDAPNRDLLHALSKSENIWERKAALFAMYALIDQKEFDDFRAIALEMAACTEETICKSLGRMLLHAGRRDQRFLLDFLEDHVQALHHRTLRKAVERLPVKAANRFNALRKERLRAMRAAQRRENAAKAKAAAELLAAADAAGAADPLQQHDAGHAVAAAAATRRRRRPSAV